ncbi:MAG TPA: hypothetical protein VF755_20055 [Catenuloplanes sp.]|jgi:acetyl-CoA C-acetyltransferase
MTVVDPTAPVIIGTGQWTHRDRTAGTSAAALLAAATDRALSDTGAVAAVRRRLTAVGVTHCLSSASGNPAGVLAAELSPAAAAPLRTVVTQPGGTGPLDLLHDACTAIRAGADGITLLTGGEAIRSLSRGHTEEATGPEPAPPDRVLGSDRAPSHPVEDRAGLFQPINYYPLFENAIRATGGWAGLHGGGGLPPLRVAEHQKWLGDLWSRFARVAATNPHAWLDGPPPDAATIATPGPGNRMVGHPYPKLLTANIAVDQAAALLVCSAATAEAAGVPRDRWVFVAASAAAHDHWAVSERADLHRSPAIAAIGRAALAHSGHGVDDLAHLDLYSCFPSAVQIAAAELGVDLSLRTPTVTGGLTFAGGPASSYSFHALAALCDQLRSDGQGAALATAVGWFLTKHAATVLSAVPPVTGYRHHDVQSEVDAGPRRRVAPEHRGAATVETWTATYDRDGTPSAAQLSCLLPDGARTVAASTEPATVDWVLASDPLGATVHVTGDGTFTT